MYKTSKQDNIFKDKSRYLGRKMGTGFTLVETLVAVTILMIAVAGPLVVAHKGLTAALYAKDQATASFLAQEAMELIRNVKDEIVYQNQNGFNDIFLSNSYFGQCNESSYCGIWVVPEDPGYIYFGPCTLLAGCNLALNISESVSQGTYYNKQIAANMSQFTRYFYLSDTVPANEKEKRVTVVVKWDEGSTPNQITLTSQIVDTNI